MSGKTFHAGLLVSFAGSLPLGIVNFSLLQISARDGNHAAILFALGSLLAEIIYIRGTLFLMGKVLKNAVIVTSIHWISLIVLVSFGVASIMSAFGPWESTHVVSENMPKFVAGLLLMAINPMQIVFWGGWLTILLEKNIMQSSSSSFHVFTCGAAAGAMIASLLFILGGQIFEEIFTPGNQYIHIGIGIILLSTAAYQLFSMIRKKTQGQSFL